MSQFTPKGLRTHPTFASTSRNFGVAAASGTLPYRAVLLDLLARVRDGRCGLMGPALFPRIAIVLQIALGATLLPVAGGPTIPAMRHWRIGVSTPTAKLRAPGEFALVGVAWATGAPAPRGVKVRTSRDGRAWSGWEDLEYGPDEGPDGATVHSTEPLWTGKARFVDVRFAGRVPTGSQVHLIDPGPEPSTPAASALASPSKPGIISRAQWGADESIRKGKPSYAEPIKLAMIHHTATANSYSKSQSAGIVRSIYAYHVKTNGWDDIGYNFVVDRYGQIFEGRYGGVDRTVVGAHAKGFNRYTSGMAVIGTFEGTSPPAATMDSLKRLVAWRLDRGFVNPLGSTTYTSGGSSKWAAGAKVSLKNVSSHRDVGNTACPGAALYNLLGGLRSAAAAYGDPKLYGPKLSGSVLTPGSDGYADNIKLSTRFSSGVSWRIEVIDPSNNVWRTWTGTGTSAAPSWNGKNASGTVAPHDVYRFRINARNSRGTVRTTYLPMKVWRYPNGTILRATSGWTGILQGGKLRHILTTKAVLTRYRWSELILVPNDLTRVYTIGKDIGFRDGSVVRADSKLWLISDGKRRPVSQSTLDALGFSRSAIIDATTAMLTVHPTGSTVSPSGGYPNGAALKGTDTREAMRLSGQARPFLTRNVRTSYAIRNVDLAGPADDEIAQASLASSIGFRDGTLVQAEGTSAAYVVANGLRRKFSTSHRFAVMGYQRSNIWIVTPAELALHKEGQPL